MPLVFAGAVLISGVVGEDAYGEDPALGALFGVLTAVAYTGFILVLREAGRDLRRPAGPLFEATFVATFVAVNLQRYFGITGVYVPLVGEWEIGAGAFVVLAIAAILSTSNAVNLTDGMDGLSGGTLVFAFLSFAFIAAARGFPWLVVLCAGIVGALLAFLWFNVHPAEFFMGDTGSLALGAALATVALTTGFVLLLPVVGVIFVAETLTVILQVGSFKLRGKRIFRMSPLHNHFELIGWPEEKVTIRFWLIGALAAIVAAILAFVTPL